MYNKLISKIVLWVALVSTALTVNAQQLSFKDLGIEGGEFEEWQKLTVGYGEPGNVADVAGSSQKAKLTQKTPGAMATGGGNIYNPGGVSVFEVSGSIEGVLSQITLQVWSAGSPVDSGSYVFKSGDLEVKGTSSEVGSGDAGVISLISFDLGESKVEGEDYSIEFKASGAHMSLVALRLDLVQVITELGFNQLDKPGWIYDGWITFTEAYGDWNAPDMEGSNEVSIDSGALLKQSVPGGMLVSGGNIYHPGAASSFVIDDAVEGDISQVVLQVWTSGSPMDTNQVTLKSGDIERSGSYSEIARKRSGHGYEIISQFNFDLGGSNISAYTIEFGASGPHMSLVSVKVSKLVNVKFDFNKQQAVAIDNPSDDRWTYPRNSTPGKRTLAPLFGYLTGEGDDLRAIRYGQMVLGYDTSGVIPVGLNREQYKIKSVTIQATVAFDEQFEYDGTRDNYSLYNGVDDTASPVELFGTGFRNGYDGLNWDETRPLNEDGAEGNNIYSIGFEGGTAIDVDTFSFSKPHSAKPFAIGTIEGLEQGELVPEDSVFRFNLDVENSAVSNYIAEGLVNGKLYFTLSQILYEELEEGGKGYPDIYTKDHILGEGASMMIEYELLPTTIEPATLNIDRITEGKLLISWNEPGILERSESLGANAEWSIVETVEMNYTVESPNGKMFFRLRGD